MSPSPPPTQVQHGADRVQRRVAVQREDPDEQHAERGRPEQHRGHPGGTPEEGRPEEQRPGEDQRPLHHEGGVHQLARRRESAAPSALMTSSAREYGPA